MSHTYTTILIQAHNTQSTYTQSVTHVPPHTQITHTHKDTHTNITQTHVHTRVHRRLRCAKQKEVPTVRTAAPKRRKKKLCDRQTCAQRDYYLWQGAMVDQVVAAVCRAPAASTRGVRHHPLHTAYHVSHITDGRL